MDPAISKDTSFIVFTLLDMNVCHASAVWPLLVCMFINNRFAFVAYSFRLAPHAGPSQLVALCRVICLALLHICASSQAVYFACVHPHTLNNPSPVLCMHFTFFHCDIFCACASWLILFDIEVANPTCNCSAVRACIQFSLVLSNRFALYTFRRKARLWTFGM